MSDGKLIFDTKLDDSGFKKGAQGLIGVAGKLGTAVTGAVAVAITAVTALAGAATKVGSEFEAGMSQVAATMGMTAQEIQNGSKELEILQSAAREMGATTQFSATQASEALNYIALAGYNANDAVKLLPKTLNLAAAGGLELGYATDIVTDAMSALGLSIEDADSFIDQMAKTSQKSNTSVGELGEAILTVGGSAKDLAGGTVELNTALGILANNGIKGAEGGTKLRNVIMSLTAPTDRASKALNALGISVFDTDGNMRPLNDTLGDMSLALSQMTTEGRKQWLNTVFNKADLAAVSALLASTATDVDGIALALEVAGGPGEEFRENIIALGKDLDQFTDKADFTNHVMEAFGLTAEQSSILYDGLVRVMSGSNAEWAELEENILNANGAAEEMSKTMLDNLKGDFTIMKSALEELGISFYEAFSVNLRGTVQTATGMIDELSLAFKGIKVDDLKNNLKEVGVDVDELGVNLVQASFKMDQFETSAEFASWAVEELGLTAEQAQFLFDELSNGLENSGDKMGIIGDVIGDIVANIISSLAELAPQAVEVGLNIVQSLIDGLTQNVDQLGRGIGRGTTEIMTTLTTGITKMLPSLVKLGAELTISIAKGLAEGLPDLVDGLQNLITSGLESLTEMEGSYWETGSEMVGNIASGLIKAIPGFIEKAGEFFAEAVAGLADALVTHGPEIIKIGLDIVKTLAQALLDNAPEIVTAAIELIVTLARALIETLITNTPDIIKGVFDLGLEIIKTIAELSLDIAKSALEIGKALVNGIIEGIGSLTGKAVDSVKGLGRKILGGIKGFFGINSPSKVMQEVGNNIAQGAIDGIAEKEGEAGEIATSFSQNVKDAINNTWEDAKTWAVTMADKLKNGIDSKKDAVKKSADIMAKESKKAIEDGWRNAKDWANKMVTNIQQGINGGKSRVINAVRSMATEATSSIQSAWSNAKQLGVNMAQGIASGIQSMAGSVMNAARSLASSATNAIKGALKIHSPSRVMRDEVGMMIGLGVAEGIKASGKNVNAELDSIVKDLENKGASVELLNIIDGMDSTEAIEYGKLLLGQNQSSFNRHLAILSQRAGLESANNFVKGFALGKQAMVDTIRQIVNAANIKARLELEANMQSLGLNKLQLAGNTGSTINVYPTTKGNSPYKDGMEIGNGIDREIRRRGI